MSQLEKYKILHFNWCWKGVEKGCRKRKRDTCKILLK